MRPHRTGIAVAAASLLLTSPVLGQNPADVQAIHRLVDEYGRLEDAMDMAAQAQLMREDRVWLAQGAGRRTDQAANTRIQQAVFDALRATVPGIQSFTEDRDRLIKFYGNGTVAVVSFYRYQTLVLPPGTPPEITATVPPAPPTSVTLVLENRANQWRIVHAHFSDLGPPVGN